MQGSMRQRGDSWQLRVFAGYDAVTGKKRWITKTVPGGKWESQRALVAVGLQGQGVIEGGEGALGAAGRTGVHGRGR